MRRNSSVESRVARSFSEGPLTIPLFLHTRGLRTTLGRWPINRARRAKRHAADARPKSEGAMWLSAKATKDPQSDHAGTISGLLLGNFAMVASLTFRCWATIAGGVWVIQSERETSMNWGALNTSRTCRSVSPVFLI